MGWGMAVRMPGSGQTRKKKRGNAKMQEKNFGIQVIVSAYSAYNQKAGLRTARKSGGHVATSRPEAAERVDFERLVLVHPQIPQNMLLSASDFPERLAVRSWGWGNGGEDAGERADQEEKARECRDAGENLEVRLWFPIIPAYNHMGNYGQPGNP